MQEKQKDTYDKKHAKPKCWSKSFEEGYDTKLKKRVVDTHFLGPYVITKCRGKELLIFIIEHTLSYKDNSILKNAHVSLVKCRLLYDSL